MLTRPQLDQLVLDVELVLLSVVQAAALGTLAAAAAPILRAPTALQYVFLGTGLFFILSFWSVALIHAISFVSWPMDLIRYFFYFAIGLLECLIFGQMDRPEAWFGYSVSCFALTLVLYVYDFGIIRRRRSAFEDSAPARALYEHIRRRQLLEMRVLVPCGLAFNLVAALVVREYPELVFALALLQLLFGAVFVISSARSFTERQRLISACAAS